ncbi:hypothetical protein P3342_000715 [Pyrenophora teres f. teres]|nr:hypothetical protein P3342_000715 [Pyrenophora teres f. teres]
MGSLRQRVGSLVALLGLFATLVSGQNTTITTTTNNTAASTFYLAKTETQFSVNIADDSDDVFIYFASPAYSWVGVGFGGKMEDSLMMIMYQSANSNNVTVSPRIGSKASEPSFNSSINLTILPGTTVTNDSMLILRAQCSNCRSYIDTKSTAQPMIYAFGKAQNLRSNSPSAHLQRHIQYGHFTMDMTAATGAGGVPAPSNALNGVGAMTGMVRDHDRANLAHTILGCLAIFLLWPLNVLVVAFFKNIKIHIVLSALIMVFLLVSFVLGGVTSSQYSQSKAFNTPHQIFAFLSLIPLLGTTLLPTLSRLSPTNLRPLHTPLASASFVLLVLTGGLGLLLSAQPTAIILVYTAISLAVAVFLFILQSCIRKRGSAHARALRRRKPELSTDSDRVVMLGAMEERGGHSSGHGSAASLSKPVAFYGAPVSYSYTVVGHGAGEDQSGEFGTHGQRSPKSSHHHHHYGGGTMPGPQYLLNMHPGVPVQVNRM